MQAVFILTGQCGNQLGFEIIDKIFDHLISTKWIDCFFNFDIELCSYQARAVCLDTEPKVVDATQNRAKMNGKWTFDQKSVAFQHGGAGNNWALGYMMGNIDSGNKFSEIALNCIRNELHKCYLPTVLIVVHSLAGGTGSGFGTRITESIQDQFPEFSVLNLAVTPYHFGEVIVQHYNALLSLAKLTESSNGMVLFENEVAQQLCKEMKGIDRPMLHDINNLISSNLIPLFIPRKDTIGSSVNSVVKVGILDEIIEMCSHPSYKFVDVKVTPQTSDKAKAFTFDSWPSLLKIIQRMQLSGSILERPTNYVIDHNRDPVQLTSKKKVYSLVDSGLPKKTNASSESVHAVRDVGSYRTLSATLTMYGDGAKEAANDLMISTNQFENSDATSKNGFVSSPINFRTHQDRKKSVKVIQSLSLAENFVSSFSKKTLQYSPVSDPISIHYTSAHINSYQRSVSLISNSQSILPILQRSTDRATELYGAKAYLHQYTSYGIEDDDFVEAFRKLGSVVQSYVDL